MELVGSCKAPLAERHIVNAWVSRMASMPDDSMMVYITLCFGERGNEDTAAICGSVRSFREE